MSAQNKLCYEFGSFRLDPVEHLLFHDGNALSLPPKAFETLLILVENHGHVVEKDELLEKVWADIFVDEANVPKYISLLRKLLSENGLEEPFIETIPTRGYRFVAPLKTVEVEPVIETRPEVSLPEEIEDTDRSIIRKPSSRRMGVRAAIFAVGIFAAVSVLAVGAWYYLPSLLTGNGSNLRTTEVSLSTGNRSASSGTISPDGKLVAFRTVNQGGTPTLVVQRVATGDLIELVPDWFAESELSATFSPDSKFIYYNLSNKGSALYRISVSGGAAEKLIPGIWSKPAVSPDGNHLAIAGVNSATRERTIFIADNDGNNLKAIFSAAPFAYYSSVGWSNDGQRVLVIVESDDNRRSLKWVDKEDKTVTEATELKPLSEQNWISVRNLVSLKDGSGFLFAGRKSYEDLPQIFHLASVDAKITQITESTTNNILRFNVSDDGKTIAVNKNGGPFANMLAYDPATNESRQIMKPNKTFVHFQPISQMPDGKILFSKAAWEGTRESQWSDLDRVPRIDERIDIFSMDEDGGVETKLTSNAGFNLDPVATADGKYIVFRSNRSGKNNLWRMDADGTNPIQLTNYFRNNMNDGNEMENDINGPISIANNGKTVFFTLNSSWFDWEVESKLMKISINGGQVSPLLPTSRTSDKALGISPDGKKLAYLSYVFDSKSSGEKRAAIFVRSLDGDEVGEIENTLEVDWFDWAYERVYWTPNGRALTFEYEKNVKSKKRYDLRKLDIETGKEIALTSFEYEAGQLAAFKWSNDGKKIFIMRWIGQPVEVVLVRNRDVSKKLY